MRVTIMQAPVIEWRITAVNPKEMKPITFFGTFGYAKCKFDAFAKLDIEGYLSYKNSSTGWRTIAMTVKD